MEKSADAFRTISEVADHLETPAHVLRFWESRFPQIKPVKRAGGRRYYRPTDVALLAGIRRLLHDEGMTIRGVQKILREQGVRHVAGLSDTDLSDAIEAPFDADDGVEATGAAQVVSISDWVGAEKAGEIPAPKGAEKAAPILQQGFKFDTQADASEG
ncbi:MAG: MerR family transcriptional regulator, partial [Paracoccaceae bacterium]